MESTSHVPLIDTGSAGFSYIPQRIAEQYKLSLSTLDNPITLCSFEGEASELPVVSLTFIFLLIGRHRERIPVFVIPRCNYDVFLGLPWLEKHNPYINFDCRTLTFGENCFKLGCINFETTVSYHHDYKTACNRSPNPLSSRRAVPDSRVNY